MPYPTRTLHIFAFLGVGALFIGCGSGMFSSDDTVDNSDASTDSATADDTAIDSGADVTLPTLMPECPPLAQKHGADTFGTYAPSSGNFAFGNCFAAPTADGTHVIVSLDPYAFSGDWQNSGLDEPGAYKPATGTFRLVQGADASGDIVFQFGGIGGKTIPLAGDWDGDGADTVGLYDVPSTTFFLTDTNAPGGADYTATFGTAKDAGADLVPLVGDWDGDGKTSIGLYDPDTGRFFLRNLIAGGPADVMFVLGAPHLVPLAGDWDGDQRSGVGTYDPLTGNVELENVAGSVDVDYRFTIDPGLNLVVGDWDGK